MTRTVALCGALLVGCASTPSPAAPDAPPFVSVTLVGLTAAPLKADGSCWDPFCSISGQDGQRLGAALAAVNPYAAVASVLTPPILQGLSKPDVGGTATLLISGVSKQSFALPPRQDTFTPQWSV